MPAARNCCQRLPIGPAAVDCRVVAGAAILPVWLGGAILVGSWRTAAAGLVLLVVQCIIFAYSLTN
jgi:hypothetical protein